MPAARVFGRSSRPAGRPREARRGSRFAGRARATVPVVALATGVTLGWVVRSPAGRHGVPQEPVEDPGDDPAGQDQHDLVGPARDLRSALRSLGLVGAPSSLVAALAFYIGFVREDTVLRYFGLDTSLLDLSVRQYMLRSTDPVIRFLVALGVVAVLLIGVHALVAPRWRGWPPRLRYRLAAGATLTGLALMLVGAISLIMLSVQLPYLAGPTSLTAGAMLTGYAARAIPQGRGAISDLAPSELRKLYWAGKAVVIVLALAGLFWAANDYARAQGLERARQLADQISVLLPRVTVYSQMPLRIDSNEPQASTAPSGSNERYRYDDLRLLTHSADNYFLITEDWTPTNGTVVMLPDNSTTRLDFSPGWAPQD